MIYLDEAIRERHSVRNFRDKVVPDKAILQILEAGRLAPSAKNRQPWRFEVVGSIHKNEISDLMKKRANEIYRADSTVATSAEIVRDAPVLVAVFAAVGGGCTASDYISIGACLENMCLKAVDLGLAGLIVCDCQDCAADIAALLGRNCELVALLVIGYECVGHRQSEKLPLETLVNGISGALFEENKGDALPQADVGEAPFLFISYSHLDSAIVVSDIVELKKHGVRLWYDASMISGEKWDERALGVIRQKNCVGVIVYISEHSVRSESVAKELLCAAEHFQGEAGRIIGIHIGDKVLSEYLYDGKPTVSHAFRTVFSDSSTYIPRARVAGMPDDILQIVDEANRLGAVRESGVYDDFRYVRTEGGVELTQYWGCSKEIELPAAIAGLPVVSLGKNMFRSNDCVEGVTIPFTVKAIKDGAFLKMSNLKTITIPENVTEIGVAAFRDCVSLKDVSLPQGLKKMSEALFRGCSSLTEFVVPETVTEFGEAVFNGCSSLCRVYMPSVEHVTEGCFYGCCELEEIIASPKLEGLEENSFLTCPKINIDLCGYRYRNAKAIMKKS